MAPIDGVIAAVLVLSVVTAARNGFFIETFSLAGVILGLLIASWNFQKPMPWLLRFIHTPPIAEAVAFLVIALLVMIAASLVGRLLRWSVHSIGLGWLDWLVGAAFGFLKGCVLVTLGVIALAAFLPHNGWLDHSELAHYFLAAAHTTATVTPNQLGERIRDGVKIIRDAQPDWLKPQAKAFAASPIAVG